MAKEITFSKDAREGLMEGVAKFSRAVKATLGPRGRYAVVDRGFGAPRVTKDGATVAEDVELTDRVENIGARIMREAASKTANEAGDGSTTSTVLAEAIFLRGMRSVVSGTNPLLLQRGLQRATQRVLDELDAMATSVKKDQIASIAAIAANNDNEVGKIIARSLEKVGKDGVVTIEEGKSFDTTVDVVEGMQFDRGYLSQYFVTDEDRGRVVLRDPYILIMEEKISNLAQIVPIMEKVLDKKRPLVIIAEDMEGEALSTVVVNKMRGTLSCAACKAPGYGDRRKALLGDIAIATGGTAIVKDLGLEPKAITLGHLGRAKRVEMTSDNTIIVQGAGAKKGIAERVRQIRLEYDQSTSDYDKEKLQERLARLTGGIAEIRVGGATETEVREKKKRFENALSATRAAVEEGILPGGGVALLNCIENLDGTRIRNRDEKLGVDILRYALEAPFRQLARNAGEEPSRILRKIRSQRGKNFGYDFEKKKECDLMREGIIDSVRVTKMALRNATSVAGMLYTTDTCVTDIPQEEGEHDHEHDHDMMDY